MQATSSHLDYRQSAPESRPRETSVAMDTDHQRPAASAPRIVAIGGGSGLPAVLSGLSKRLAHPDDKWAALALERSDTLDRLTGVVTMTDDGGSSGRLRTQLGVLPPGDVRNCLAALAGEGSPLVDLMQHRFSGTNGLSGHAVGNLMLAALTQMNGDFTLAVDQLSGILGLRGRVLPSTPENVTLRAEFDRDETVAGETAIVARDEPIKRVWLDRDVRPLPAVLRAVVNADIIVVGPGSLYTSILPNLLVGGLAATIAGVDAVRIYVANLMTEPGETVGLDLAEHLDVIRRHVGSDLDLFDYVLVNSRPPDERLIEKYAARGARPLQRRWERTCGRAELVEWDLAVEVAGGKIRHAPDHLAEAILELGRRGRPGNQN